jgi:hypothetical protein
MTAGRAVATRLVVAAVVASVIVGVAGITPILSPSQGGGGIAEGPEQSEWEPSKLAPQRLESAGDPDPKGDVGVVLFDRSHGNRFEKEDIAPLVDAINDAGGEVRFTGELGTFSEVLPQADVLVVIDPARRYDAEEVGEINQFVKDGGHLLMFAEPNRKEVQQSGFFVSLVTKRSALDSLGSRFSVSFGSHYVYDMEHNDGNYKSPVTSPPDRADSAVVEGVDRVTMYTATSVSVNRGQVLLRTAPTAERGDEAATRGFPVAVLSRNGQVMAVGDKTFLNDQFHTVADNDVFIQRVVEFMVGADHRGSDIDGDGESAEPAVESVDRGAD